MSWNNKQSSHSRQISYSLMEAMDSPDEVVGVNAEILSSLIG